MAAVLSFPIRLLPNGALASVEQTSDAGQAEAIAQLILTRPGEREMVPGFGLPDPVFAGFDRSALAAGVAAYGPDVDIDDVVLTAQPDGITQAVLVTFR